MHELSIAATIMEDVLEFMQTRQIARVTRVRLAIGELTCIQPEQLKFCYESVTRDTPLDGSILEIETTPARVRCTSCSYQGPPKYWMNSLAETPTPTLQCPQCGKATEAELGHDCAIRSIQYAA